MNIVERRGDSRTGTEIWDYNGIPIGRDHNGHWTVLLHNTEMRIPSDITLDAEREKYFNDTDPYLWLNYAVNVYFK